MSRTVRRLKKIDSACDKGYTTQDDQEHIDLHGGYCKYGYFGLAWGSRKVIPLEGNDFNKGWWKYHRDHHRSWCGGKKLHRADWGQVRNKNRKNLAKWMRDPENNDVFFWEDVNTKDWD